jgi:hypothetical protein
MALTISNHPSRPVTNEPSVDVTTSLTEGASYQNLRIRAEVFVAGNTSKVATLEQVKGLDNWDFSKLLKNFIGRCDAPVGGSERMITPDVGSELLTGWDPDGDYDTFTFSGREITALTGSGPGDAVAVSNDLGGFSIGDLLVIGFEYIYTNTGADTATFGLSNTDVLVLDATNKWPFIDKAERRIFFYLPTDYEFETECHLTIGGENIDVTLLATIHKITDFKNNPGVYFRVKFTEVYENSSGVTTTGATAETDAMLYMPAIMPEGEDFNTNYLTSAGGSSGSKFLNKSVRNGMQFINGIGMEMRLLFVTDEPVILPYDTQNASGSEKTGCGWGMLVINDNIIAFPENSNIQVAIFSKSGVTTTESIKETYRINLSNKCYEDMQTLTFVGDLGEEIFYFTGGTDKGYKVERESMRKENGIMKHLSAYRKTEMDLYTGWVDEDLLPLFLELLSTVIQVKMIDTDQTDNVIDVTITDQAMNVKQREQLKQHKIGIEYHE